MHLSFFSNSKLSLYKKGPGGLPLQMQVSPGCTLAAAQWPSYYSNIIVYGTYIMHRLTDCSSSDELLPHVIDNPTMAA